LKKRNELRLIVKRRKDEMSNDIEKEAEVEEEAEEEMVYEED
jgi:hypothetical protein